MSASELLSVAGQFALLSLLSIGGVNAILADSQRILVLQRGWLDEAGFAQAVALGQAAPGPNIMVVGVLGWMAAGPAGLLACLGGVLLPSTLLVWRYARWAEANRSHPLLLAFQRGCAPLVLGLSLSGAWVLVQPYTQAGWPAWTLVAAVAVGSAGSKLPPLLWLGLGAAGGAFGLW